MALEVVVLDLLAFREELSQVVHHPLVLSVALRRVQLYLLFHLLLLLVNLHVQELLD